MEPADVLRIGNGRRVLVVVAAPDQLVQVARVQDVDNGCSVQGPAVHVGVQALVGHGAEEEGFALLPRCAGDDPLVGHRLKAAVRGVLGQGVHIGIQLGCGILQVEVGRQYDIVHIGIDHLVKQVVAGQGLSGIEDATQLVLQQGSQFQASLLGIQGLLAVDVAAEGGGDGQDGIVGVLDGLHGLVGQFAVAVVLQYIIDRVLCHGGAFQIQLVAGHHHVSRPGNGAVDGDDVVGVVLAGVPAEPGLHGVEGALRVAADVHVIRVANLGIAHLVGNVIATVDNLLHTEGCGLEVAGDVVVLEDFGIAVAAVVILHVPIIIQVGGIAVEQASHFAHVSIPVGGVLRGDVNLFYVRAAGVATVVVVVVAASRGSKTYAERHGCCIQEILLHVLFCLLR